MDYKTTRDLARLFGREFSRLHNFNHGTAYPEDISLDDAKLRLHLLYQRVGSDTFRSIAARWEQELIPGIDLEFRETERTQYENQLQTWRDQL